MKKTLLSLAMTAALGLSAVSAFALPVWLVDEGVVAGAAANVVTTDRITGTYNELTGLGSTGLGSFSSSAVGVFGDYLLNTVAQTSQLHASLGEPFSANQYRMYVKFLSQGTVSGGLFTGTSGSAQIWLDTKSDTAFSLPNGTGFTSFTSYASATAGAGEDKMIAESLISYGTGQPGGAPSAFEIFFDEVTLTSFGSTFWFDPVPFHMTLRATGGTSGFDGTTYPFTSNGDFSITAVPEPASLALVGLGLLGLGLSRRRKS